MQDIMTMSQALSSLDNTVNSFLLSNLLAIQNLVYAAQGRAISSLFPVKDLLHTLYIGKQDFNLSSLFDSRSTISYWSLW